MKICSIEGCDKKVASKGYCIKHYTRFRRYGDPLIVKRNREHDPICKVKGCNSKHESLGYCHKHYIRFKKYGDPLYVKPVEICKIEGCDLKSRASGYCQKHYRRGYRHGNPLTTKIETHDKSNSPEYYTWGAMKQRCYNPESKFYPRYGGRGITVCDRWNNSFTAFFEDMGLRPSPKHQIDRIYNDGNYEPGNCRWVTNEVNTRNRSTTKLNMIKAEDIRKQYKVGNITQKELSKIYGISLITVNRIINNKQWIKEEMR